MIKSKAPPLFIAAHGRYYVSFFVDEVTVDVREYTSSDSIGKSILQIEVHGVYMTCKHTACEHAARGTREAKIGGTLVDAIKEFINDSVKLRGQPRSFAECRHVEC
jgi:hypothetical protein